MMPNIKMKKMKEFIRDVNLKLNTLSSSFYVKRTEKLSESQRNDRKITDLDNPLGRLPMWARKTSNINMKSIAKINRFLKFQGKRINEAVKKGEINKAVMIWLILLKNSKAYQLYLFNKAVPYWYWKFTEQETKDILTRIINKCRKQDLWLMLKRFYVLKSDGKRWRPIGAPDLPARVIGKGLNDLIYTIFRDEFKSFQHGYRTGKGLHTAIYDIIQRLKMNPKIIFEFDLTAYFNRVKPMVVYEVLKKKSEVLALYIYNILLKIKYDFKELKEEEELKWTNPESKKEIQKIIRRGMPQGLTISPVLSTLTLETNDKWNNCVMYADDGIYIGNSVSKFKKWWETKFFNGAEFNKEKSREVKEKVMFLGIEIDIKNRTVAYGLNKMSWEDKNLMSWLRTVVSKYSKRNEKWRWEIKIGSYLNSAKIPRTWDISDLPMILLNSLKGMEFKGYRMFKLGMGIQDIPGSSSICLTLLIEDMKELKLVGISPFRKVLRPYLVDKSLAWNEEFEIDEVPEGFLELIESLETKRNESFFLEEDMHLKNPKIKKFVGRKTYIETMYSDVNNKQTKVK